MSENKLVARLRKFGKTNAFVTRGIGDDGAVVEIPGGPYVFVQDAMVEHIHFEFSFVDPYDVGKKAVYINVSDVLSMGAEPLYFLATIAVPDHMTHKSIDRLYRGMSRAAKEFDILLLGGDTTGSRVDFFIDVSMVGRLVTDTYLGRDTAKTGDLIAVTGYLGESAYGLHVLQNGKKARGLYRFIKRYASPRPPFAVWKELIKSGITNAMMDISDGLLIDLERMMAESRKAARIHLECVPIPGILRREQKESLALSGGEDYQFLFTFPKDKRPVVAEMIERGLLISIIGEVLSGKGVEVYEKGRKTLVPLKGYEHFGNL